LTNWSRKLTAQTKISADLIITLRKESDSHALEAKLAREVSEDVFNGTYTGGQSYTNPLVVINLL
jgi:hypothetical protein